MTRSPTFKLLTLVSAISSQSLTRVSAGGGSTLHVCNRGFCYNKKEDVVDPLPSLNAKQHGSHSNHLFSSFSASDLDLLSILGAALLDDIEAVECLNCPPEEEQQPNDTSSETNLEWETLEDADLDTRRSWKEEPKKGQCLDNELGYVYDCNLIEILDEGSVLIEDLRSDGALTAQPKSNFSNKKNKQKKQQWQSSSSLPPVVVTGEDPNEDFRTVVELNMMGI